MAPHYGQTVGVPGEEDPLQGPRPPERNIMRRAKRLSCRLSERASVLWTGGWGGQEDDTPPPVPRHRTDPSKYDVVVSDRNHVRLLEARTRSYTCKELLCIVFVPCLLICILGIVCSSLVIHHVLGKVRKAFHCLIFLVMEKGIGKVLELLCDSNWQGSNSKSILFYCPRVLGVMISMM